ncbi:MAG: hypothetical protein ACLQU3_03915 [Limisphaerales bacterium]
MATLGERRTHVVDLVGRGWQPDGLPSNYGMVISYVVAPEIAQQIHAQPPQPPAAPLDAVDEQIIAALRAHGRYGAGVWELLNPLATDQGHESRADLRAARLALWGRLRGLLKRGLVFRQGRKRISLVKLPQQGVRRRRRSRGGSTVSSGLDRNLASHPKHLSSILLSQEALPPATSPIPHKSQSAEAPPRIPVTDNRRDQIRRAAIALAKMPRGKKGPLTGYLRGQRTRRGQPILLPDGRRAFVWGCRRGKVVWSLDPRELLCGVLNVGVEWGVLPEAQVTLQKCEAAAVLGGLKKGCQEVYSALKAAAARRNGVKPCHIGRRRGRPGKLPLADSAAWVKS